MHDPAAAEQLVSMLQMLEQALLELEQRREQTPRSSASGGGGGSKRKKTSSSSRPPHGSWLFQLLRHANNADARKVVRNVFVLIKRMDELEAHWGSQAGRITVEIPDTSLNACSHQFRRPEDLQLSDEVGFSLDEVLLGSGQDEFATEVGWLAHPERRGVMGRLWHSTPSQMLDAALKGTKFNGHTPT